MRRLQALIGIFAALTFLAGCGPEDGDDPGGGTDAGTDTSQAPVIEEVTVTENPNNVLSAYVGVQTDKPASVAVDIMRDGKVVRTIEAEEAKKEHELLAVGLYAETKHTLSVVATADGETAMNQKEYTTSALPEDFPPLEVKTSNPDLAADGYRLMDVFRWKQSSEDTHGLAEDWGMAIIVDEHGKPVWYYQADHPVWDFTRTANGTFIYNADPHGIVEIDLKGEVVNEWDAKEDLGREMANNEFAVHHGVSPLGDGTFVTLSTEMREVQDFKKQGETADVVADVAVEFNRSGEVLGTWSMFDVLEDYKTRKRVGSVGPYWDKYYGESAHDWTHGNAVEAGDTDGTLIASLRHQDWVVKWDKESGELIWRLGPEGDFEFADGSDGKFNYHQHAPEWLENGNLIVYDNGNSRPSIQEGNQYYTRVVEYDLDASNVDIDAGKKGTVEQVWSYKSDPKFYAPYVGDADLLPNGNVLIGDGGLLGDPSQCIKFEQGDPVDMSGACISTQDNLKWSRILEVTHDEAKEKALEVWLKDISSEPRSYTMYRSDYISNLQP